MREAWNNPARTVQSLYITEAALRDFKKETETGAQPVKRPVPTVVTKETLDRAFPPGTVHQGIALSAQPLAEVSLADLLIAAKDKTHSLILILDQVTDPHNVGAIMRSACAFGADGIVMQRRHAPELTGALAKAACGAAEHVPVASETNLTRAIEELQEAGYRVYGLDERGETEIGEAGPTDRTALVLGAEGPGLRHLVRERCDALLRLPMAGPMPSINVSNAAAIALYALTRK